MTLTSSPQGIRLGGDVDRRHLPAFTEALAEVASNAASITLDLRSLTFIDVAAVAAIANVVEELDQGLQVVSILRRRWHDGLCEGPAGGSTAAPDDYGELVGGRFRYDRGRAHGANGMTTVVPVPGCSTSCSTR